MSIAFSNRKPIYSRLLLTLFVLLLLLTGCRTIRPTPYEPTGTATNTPIIKATQEQESVEVVRVTAKSNAFAPAEIIIPAGTTVTWIQDDAEAHTITADDGLFNSGDLRQGDTFSFTFNFSGMYTYHCKHHGESKGMSGVITVVEAPSQ